MLIKGLSSLNFQHYVVYLFIKENTINKNISMKKVIVFVVLISCAIVVLSSCGPSRRGTGCPGTEGIIH
jgi:hypothetical protein